MNFASIGPIAIHLPEAVETNAQLQAEYPQWNMELIEQKTGIKSRHIAAPGECASDLGVKAAEKLFKEYNIDPQSVDFVLFCTQAPDYPLPTTACLLQHRLGLRTNVGALDFNLGCSGYVYGLGLADGLIRAGMAKRILFITAETYSKYINHDDRSLRTIFGDGAAATIIDAAPEASLLAFQYGTDGSGADALLVNSGGARRKEDAIQPRKRQRWSSPLFMDGPALVDFTVERIPGLIDKIIQEAGMTRDNVDLYLLHQATYLLLGKLEEKLALDETKMPRCLAEYGNTVSSTLPIMLHDLRASGRLRPGTKSLLVGYGVGFSWAGCVWTETWSAATAKAEGRYVAA